jgi:FMN-dependent NADH-azoreductase
MNILHIDSSILGEYSASRRLTAAIAARFKTVAPGSSLVYRDVVQKEVPQVTGALAAFATIPLDQQSVELRAAAAERDSIVEEVLASDVIIIGAPMYNFGVSSQLKAWIDALAIPGKTFTYDANGPKGLLGGKRVIVASTRGNIYSEGTAYAALDHQENYLRSFFTFLGVTDFEVVRAEGLKVSDEMNQASMEAGLRQAAELAVA